jgi:acetolactate synthase-1/2/3 large subunit
MINNYRLVEVLSDQCTKDDVISPGMSSTCANHIWQAWKVKYGQRFSYAGAMGAMGTGLPGAIGACLGSGRRRTICVNGDGGFQLNIQELEVVKRLQLPIKFFVLSNGGYAAIMNTQRKYFDSHYVGCNEPDFTLPDIRKVAEAYGIKTYLIENDNEIEKVVKQALSDNLPCLVEVIESNEQETAMRVGTKMVDGKPVSMKFEEV